MDHYVPMTPELRRGAIASIDEKLEKSKRAKILRGQICI